MANDNFNRKIDKDELLDEQQLDNVVGGFNFTNQLNGEGLDKLRQQFNQSVFGKVIQNGNRPA